MMIKYFLKLNFQLHLNSDCLLRLKEEIALERELNILIYSYHLNLNETESMII